MIRSRLIAVPLAAALAAPVLGTEARADEVTTARETSREDILEGQPAVRHRLLLVSGRIELTPTFETSINSDFRHTVSGGLKAEYHLSDMWSIGGIGLFGTSFNTGLTTRIVDTLEDAYQAGDPTPTALEFDEHLNSIPMHGAAYISWQPWYGKLAAFGKAFVAFDFYFQGGLAMVQLDNTCCSFNPDPFPEGDLENGGRPPDRDPNNDAPLNDGLKVGIYLGGGVHVFLSEWLALDLSFRDYWFQDNPSGLDFDADLAVTEDDARFLNHFFAGVGVSVFLPTTPDRTR
jgi:outer membrane beta-barrel protein